MDRRLLSILPLTLLPLLWLWRPELAGLVAALAGLCLLARRAPAVALGAALVMVGWAWCFFAPKIEWDGAGYYAQARSAVFDGDLDFANDAALMPTLGLLAREAPSGRVALPFPVGPALTWMPWMAPLKWLGAGATGLERPYVLGVGLTGLLLGLVGVVALVRARTATGEAPSPREQAVRLLVAFASMAPFYWTWQPAYSHALQWAVSALALGGWSAMRGRIGRGQGWSLAFPGLVCGLMFLARWQHLLVAIVFAAPLWELLRVRPRAAATMVVASAAAFALCLVPQAIVLGATWGEWWRLPRMEPGFFNPASPHLGGVLFSTWNGLFASHPALLAGVVGWAVLFRRDPALRPLLAAVALWMVAEVWVVSSVADWHGGGAFGQRRLTGLVPWLAWLAAGGLEGPKGLEGLKGRWRPVAARALALLAAANFLYAGAQAHGRVPGSPADPSNYIHTKRRTPYAPYGYGPMMGDRLRGAAWFVQKAVADGS